MIPSEFNQDAMAQRRKLRMLHESRQNLQEKVAVVATNLATGEVFLNLAAGSSKFEQSQVSGINDSVRKLTAALKGAGGGTVFQAAKKLQRPRSDRRFWSVSLFDKPKASDVVTWVRQVLGKSFTESVNESIDLTERDKK